MKLVPKLSFCCCGCSLRTGTLIFLWLSLAVSFLLIFRVAGGVSSSLSQYAKSNSDVLISYLEIVQSIGVAFLAICGIIGVYTKKSSLLVPFMVFNVMGIVVLLFAGLSLLLALLFSRDALVNTLYIDSREKDKNIILAGAIATNVMILIQAAYNYYMIAVMYNCYCQLKEETAVNTISNVETA